MIVKITTTCSNQKEAQKIAKSLLKKKLIACANWWAVSSGYRWKGKIVSDKEVMLACKTTRSKVHAVQKEIERLHSYDLPVVTIDPVETSIEATHWVAGSVKE